MVINNLLVLTGYGNCSVKLNSVIATTTGKHGITLFQDNFLI